MTSSQVEKVLKDAKIVATLEIISDDGVISSTTLNEFLSRIPLSTHENVLYVDGVPSREAEQRLKSAIFAYAYEDLFLIEKYLEAPSEQTGNLLLALDNSSISLSRLKVLPIVFDITYFVSQAAKRAVLARLKGVGIGYDIGQMDLFENKKENNAENQFLLLFAQYLEMPAEISKRLVAVAKLLEEATASIRNVPQMDGFKEMKLPTRRQTLMEEISIPSSSKESRMSPSALDYWHKNGSQWLNAIFQGRKPSRRFIEGLMKIGAQSQS